MTVDPVDLPLSFGAEQLVAGTRQVRRTVGGGELDLHHWLAALLKHEDVARRALGEVDRVALSRALDRRFDEGGLDFPFPRSEAVTRASQRARRAGHQVVTTDDLAGAIATASAAVVRRLVPSAAGTGSVHDGHGTVKARPSKAGLATVRPRRTIRAKIADGLDDLVAWDHWGWVGLALLILIVLIPIGILLNRQRASDAEDAVRDRVQQLTAALADGDGDTACEMLSDEAADELVAEVQQRLAEPEPRSCAGAVQVAAGERADADDEALRSPDLGEVTYEEEWTPGIGEDPGRFEQATATAELAGGEVGLLSETVRTDRPGAWTITAPGPILDLVVPL